LSMTNWALVYRRRARAKINTGRGHHIPAKEGRGESRGEPPPREANEAVVMKGAGTGATSAPPVTIMGAAGVAMT